MRFLGLIRDEKDPAAVRHTGLADVARMHAARSAERGPTVLSLLRMAPGRAERVGECDDTSRCGEELAKQYHDKCRADLVQHIEAVFVACQAEW
jgi:hypothetical protein